MPKTAMLKALAIKELRESAAVIGVAALAILWLLGNLMGWQLTPFAVVDDVVHSIPFVSSEFLELLIPIGGALAIALGLKQGAWENSGKQYYFLLHRPISKRDIFCIKIVFGLACLLLLTVGPTMIYAMWASTPGNHATPFFWGMTTPAWQACFSFPSIYLAALLCGLRPARWLGTRLLPLVGAGMFTILSIAIWTELHWLLGLSCLIVLDLLLLRLILAVAKWRDY